MAFALVTVLLGVAVFPAAESVLEVLEAVAVHQVAVRGVAFTRPRPLLPPPVRLVMRPARPAVCLRRTRLPTAERVLQILVVVAVR